jgi:hypothetical protein
VGGGIAGVAPAFDPNIPASSTVTVAVKAIAKASLRIGPSVIIREARKLA